ncbi:hypothetical protein AA0114_g5134 [Alternaria tenuissima]|uniref:Annexin n=1 Tax=Alternaria tenuissima TaxID=119927 RepID=A0A4Q4MI43_9PLEO|nr:hypothetical protein AA0114_g5134 [Alternaria tenuissima]
MGNYTDLPPHERPGYSQPASFARPAPTAGPSAGVSYAQPGNVQYAPTAHNFAYTAAPASHNAPTRTPAATATSNGGPQYANPTLQYTAKPVGGAGQPPHVRHNSQPMSPSYPPSAQLQYTAASQAPSPQPQYTTMSHAPPPPSQYPPMSQAPPPQSQYATMPQAPQPPPTDQSGYPPPPMGHHAQRPDHHRAASYSGPMSTHDGRNVVELRPQGHLGAGDRPDGLRMDRLSVSGNRPDLHTIVPGGMPGGFPTGLPPPSPLLEAYHGTYQSISPMPQALMLDDDLDHLPALDTLSPRTSGHSIHGRHRSHSTSRRSPSPSRSSKHNDKLALAAYGRGERLPEKKERRARVYDATDDALALVDALAARTPDVDTIVDILPALSHDQMLELRAEYKRHCKVQGRGINIAKHIKLKTSGNFGKIAYVTALGKYEGEGYWANYWYQSNSARRELLIESLMGRQNYEIREIKDAFKDKRYSDSLTRCMDKELKADKFRKAVLMALEGERQEESDVWPPEYRMRDVDALYRAVRAREGGESTMLSIVIMRSDAHLREVLRTYEKKYQGNFARDALKKSNNLVGEVIAHILNGVINRPARDAMLLHHALMDLMEPVNDSRSSNSRLSSREATSSKHERQQRVELLISRLVRLHWDRQHLFRVKAEYEEKYGRVVEEDIEEATRGDLRAFSIAICQTAR